MEIPLIKEFHFRADIGKVWQALTDIEKMKRWYFPQLQQFEPVPGYKFLFEDDNRQYSKEWLVTKVIKGKTLAHSWAYKGYPGISEVTFELFDSGNETMLRLTQTGLESFPDHPHFNRARFESGWDTLLGQNLRTLLENDKGS